MDCKKCLGTQKLALAVGLDVCYASYGFTAVWMSQYYLGYWTFLTWIVKKIQRISPKANCFALWIAPRVNLNHCLRGLIYSVERCSLRTKTEILNIFVDAFEKQLSFSFQSFDASSSDESVKCASNSYYHLVYSYWKTYQRVFVYFEHSLMCRALALLESDDLYCRLSTMPALASMWDYSELMLYEQSMRVVSKSDQLVIDEYPNYSAVSIAFPRIIVTK